jgi:hypothetical protein
MALAMIDAEILALQSKRALILHAEEISIAKQELKEARE